MNINTSLSKLSIVVPVYNVSQYVITAIDSVINQTVSPYEVIIVNDGSTDDSGDLIEKHYNSLNYVKIIHTVNQGLGEARNVGTRAATGDYIYYFDSDDFLELNLVKDFYKILSRNKNLDILAFSAESFFDDLAEPNADTQTKLPRYRRASEATYSDGESAFNAMSRKDNFFPNAWLYIYHRRLHTQNGLFFKPIIHEDEEFTPRLFFSAGITVVTDKVYFKRRVRPGSIMQSGRSEKNAVGYLCSIEALESLIPVCKYEESKKNIKQRIVNNIINIMLIEKKSKVNFSSKTKVEFQNVFNANNSFMLRIASVNFFSYRLARFVLRKFRAVFSLSSNIS